MKSWFIGLAILALLLTPITGWADQAAAPVMLDGFAEADAIWNFQFGLIPRREAPPVEARDIHVQEEVTGLKVSPHDPKFNPGQSSS